jgi:hypothetical protein
LEGTRGRRSFLICTEAGKQALRCQTRIDFAAFVLAWAAHSQQKRDQSFKQIRIALDPSRGPLVSIRTAPIFGQSSEGLQRTWLIVYEAKSAV